MDTKATMFVLSRVSLVVALLLIVGAAACSPQDVPDADSGRRPDAMDAVDATGVPLDATTPADVPSVDDRPPCTSNSDCDDGNPRTHDECVLLMACVHIECIDAAVCDDSDPNTDDLCVTGSDGVSRHCEHPLMPYRCRVASDCIGGIACSTQRCVDGICRFDADLACRLHCESLPPCEVRDAIGTPCGLLPVARPTCIATPGPCPEIHACGNNFYPSYAAGPACPGTPCPVTPPAAGVACPADGPIGCDYGTEPARVCSTAELGPGGGTDGTHPVGRPRCYCSPGGTWACQTDQCPIVPPADGDTAPSGPPYSTCRYLDYTCQMRIDPPGSTTVTWRCFYPRVCPRVAADGSACDRRQDDFCSYERQNGAQPATQYSGGCTCGVDGRWHCDPNASADCPAMQPVTTSLPLDCSRTTGNSRCVYFTGTSSTIAPRGRCQCTGIWQCSGP